MSNDFLRSYTIPFVKNSDESPKIDESCNDIHSPIEKAERSNFNRKEDEADSLETPVTLKRKPSLDTSVSQEIAIFPGRDASYPLELNRLINPLACEVCNVKMNSPKSAKDHYESKAHVSKVVAWLTEHYPENPPPIKRFLADCRKGPDAFHCELCDLALTSLAHANQHYAGRKHKLVANNISKPSGYGYYNAEGKWIRTGSKILSKNEDGRFGIGEDFTKNSETLLQTDDVMYADTSADHSLAKVTPTVQSDESLCCRLCRISVTSSAQMKMHLEGAKHRKKLARNNTDTKGDDDTTASALTSDAMAEDSILASINVKVDACSDLSMYRTPTGSYYCKTCNMSMSHVSGLQQHIQGKKHIKKVNEEKAIQPNEIQNNKN